MTSALTETHRQAQLALRAATVRDLLTLWPALDVRRLDETFPAWSRSVTLLLQRNRTTSTHLAAAYLQAFRAAHIGLSAFIPKPAPPAEEKTVTAALIATAVLPIKKAMSRDVLLDAAANAAFVLSSGAISKYVLDGGRETVIGTVKADKRAKGWRRVTDGAPCAFCALLATRGAVYWEDTGTFQSHGHCGCTAEPVYTVADAGPRPEALPWRDLYEQSTAGVHGTKPALTAFRAAYADQYGR